MRKIADSCKDCGTEITRSNKLGSGVSIKIKHTCFSCQKERKRLRALEYKKATRESGLSVFFIQFFNDKIKCITRHQYQ